MTTLRRRPARCEIEVPATRPGLRRLLAGFSRFATDAGLADGVCHDMYLALDEIASNVVKYGGRATGGRIRLRSSIDAGALVTSLADNGGAFNPLAAPRARTDQAIEDRPIGGLGILLVRELMDDVRYTRRAGWNHLTLKKTL